MHDPTLVFTVAGFALLGIGFTFGAWFTAIRHDLQIRDAYLEGRRDTEAAFDALLKIPANGLLRDVSGDIDILLGKGEQP